MNGEEWQELPPLRSTGSLDALRRYRRLCDARPPGQEPQCWEAETEIGEAWRAMPRWLRACLLLYPRPCWREAVWELRTPAERVQP